MLRYVCICCQHCRVLIHDMRSPSPLVMSLKGHDNVIMDVQMDSWKVASGRQAASLTTLPSPTSFLPLLSFLPPLLLSTTTFVITNLYHLLTTTSLLTTPHYNLPPHRPSLQPPSSPPLTTTSPSPPSPLPSPPTTAWTVHVWCGTSEWPLFCGRAMQGRTHTSSGVL